MKSLTLLPFLLVLGAFMVQGSPAMEKEATKRLKELMFERKAAELKREHEDKSKKTSENLDQILLRDLYNILGMKRQYGDCNPEDFTCANYNCVPPDWVCDSDNDCGDYSDEVNCRMHCDSDNIMCANGEKCIIWHWRCDGEQDCKDNSDEMHCQ